MAEKKLLSVIGPTAVGKTGLALEIAARALQQGKVLEVHVISADSRQVFQGLEVMTGADVPADFRRQPAEPTFAFEYFQHASLPLFLHGISIISASQEWSVAHFIALARQVIQVAWKKGALVILVGGTGLYHEKIFASDEQLHIPPDEVVRARAAELELPALQDWVQQVSPAHWAQLNHSDKHNPRRLVRAIEISQGTAAEPLTHSLTQSKDQRLQRSTSQPSDPQLPDQTLTIGLIHDLTEIEKRIGTRVQTRLETGAQAEVSRLLESPTQISKQAQSTLGVQEVAALLAGTATKSGVVEHWVRREFQYAKRQLTWWRKYGQAVEWFDLSQSSARTQAVARGFDWV